MNLTKVDSLPLVNIERKGGGRIMAESFRKSSFIGAG